MARSNGSQGSRLFTLGAAAMVVGGLSLVVVSATLARTDQPDQVTAVPVAVATPAERCALPPGIDLDALTARTADRLAGQGALCMDYEHGRIGLQGYRSGLADLTRLALPPLPDRLWATDVIQSSSEYTSDSWSARQVLGAADVYPTGGDNALAWASSEEDDKVEFIEVAVPTGRVSAVEVYETYNPGAISRIELITSQGERERVYTAMAEPMGSEANLRTVQLSCSEQEVVAVRVTLDSAAVPGWNEIDAIAVKPCR